MTHEIIASLFQSAELALCPQRAAPLFNLPLSHVCAIGTQGHPVTNASLVKRGERFAVQQAVAVVPVKGILTANMFELERYLGWTTYHGFEDTLAHLRMRDDVSAIVLEFDTPGGMVLGVEAAHAAIVACAASKPVYALAHPLCASAGYWLASAATHITATPGASVGSIGAMMTAYSSVQAGFDGVQAFEMRSSYAQAKNADPATEDGRIEIQRVLDLTEARFHAAIAQGRKMAVADLPARLSATNDPKDGGRAFDALEAQARGLIDAVETRDAFYGRVFEAYAPKSRSASVGRRASLSVRAKAAYAMSLC